MTTTNTTIKPEFNRVQQSNDFDDAFACIAMLAGKTLDEVRQVAIDKFKHPKHGPFWITDDLISKLLAQFGWVGTVYQQGTGISSLPKYAIGMVEFNEELDHGRSVLFVRSGPEGGKPGVEYIIDPAYWIDEAQQIRTDIKAFPIAWYIGCHRANKSQAKGNS